MCGKFVLANWICLAKSLKMVRKWLTYFKLCLCIVYKWRYFIGYYYTCNMTSQLFDQILVEEADTRNYDLNAVIAYYGKHYSTFCYHGKHKEWVYLDDANVRKVSVTHNSYRLLVWGYYSIPQSVVCCFSCDPRWARNGVM